MQQGREGRADAVWQGCRRDASGWACGVGASALAHLLSYLRQGIAALPACSPACPRAYCEHTRTYTPLPRRFTNARGEGKFFSFDLRDGSGEIRAIGWNDAVDRFYDSVVVGQVYLLSRASLRNKKQVRRRRVYLLSRASLRNKKQVRRGRVYLLPKRGRRSGPVAVLAGPCSRKLADTWARRRC